MVIFFGNNCDFIKFRHAIEAKGDAESKDEYEYEYEYKYEDEDGDGDTKMAREKAETGE